MKRNTFTSVLTTLLLSSSVLFGQNGNLGIGTSTPSEKLTVNGNIQVNNESSTYGTFIRAGNAENVLMTMQSTRASSPYGARGVVGTTSAHPLQLVYNASPVVYMDNGTLAPNGTNLTYLGADLNRWNGVFAGGGGFDAKNASGLYVGLQTESQNGVQSIFGSAAAASAFGAATYIGSKTAHQVNFLYNNTPVMFMNDQGFYPNGNNQKSLGYVGTAGLTQVVAYAFTNPSDVRFKKNIKNLNYGIADIMKIRSVTYDLKDNKNEHLMIGFIAQEMEKVIPEIVNTNKDSAGYKSIDYVKLIPVLTKGIQEQQLVIASQNGELKELKSVIEKQARQITELKAQHIDEKQILELAIQVKELQQMLGMKPITTGIKVAQR